MLIALRCISHIGSFFIFSEAAVFQAKHVKTLPLERQYVEVILLSRI